MRSRDKDVPFAVVNERPEPRRGGPASEFTKAVLATAQDGTSSVSVEGLNQAALTSRRNALMEVARRRNLRLRTRRKADGTCLFWMVPREGGHDV